MKALVYGRKAWETVSDPAIEAATDAIVPIMATMSSGPDLSCGRGAVETQAEARTRGRLR